MQMFQFPGKCFNLHTKVLIFIRSNVAESNTFGSCHQNVLNFRQMFFDPVGTQEWKHFGPKVSSTNKRKDTARST